MSKVNSVDMETTSASDFRYDYHVYSKSDKQPVNEAFVIGQLWAKKTIESTRLLLQGVQKKSKDQQHKGWKRFDHLSGILNQLRQDHPQCRAYDLMDGKALTQMSQLHWQDTIASQADQSLWIALGFHHFVHDRIARKMDDGKHHFSVPEVPLYAFAGAGVVECHFGCHHGQTGLAIHRQAAQALDINPRQHALDRHHHGEVRLQA